MRKLAFVGIVLFACAVAACQTTGTGTVGDGGASSLNMSGRVSRDDYNIFFDQGDHLAELVESQKFAAASTLYGEQTAFFENKEMALKYAPALKKAADALNDTLGRGLLEAKAQLDAETWPAPAGRWNDLRGLLARASDRVRSYDGYPLLKAIAYRHPAADALAALIEDWKTSLRRSASQQFLEFDHFSGTSFFGTYPIPLNGADFLRDNPTALQTVLANRRADRLEAFARGYSEAELGGDAWTQFSDALIAAKAADLRKQGDDELTARIGAIMAIRGFALTPKAGFSLKVAFVEATSKTLLKEGAIDFPVAVDMDLPIEATKASLDAALTNGGKSAADYVIVFDVALATVRRRVTGIEKKPARVQVGTRTEPNPERNQIQIDLSRAQMDLNQANMDRVSNSATSAGCYGLGCLGYAFAGAIHASRAEEARKNVENIMGRLNATPMTIEVPVYQNYKFDLAKIRARKTMTVHYHLIDLKRKRHFKSTFDVVEDKLFEVAYKVHDNDPNRDAHISAHHKEKDVADWEKAASTVKMSSLLMHYLTNRRAAKPLPNLAALREEMLRDKNLALAKYKEQTFEGSTQNDPRFDSVVVVFNPQGSLGSGFFVRPDVVMTNYHVVEQQEFVEMRLYDKRETFGKVIARDAGLDLALIKVQTRGKPISFFSRNQVDLGSTVEVIGHPQGYDYSITRGVVSAVRRAGTAVMDAGQGVLQIQVDAAISPGNSGGPAFHKDRVVGVVSWIRVDRGSQNLNFLIHYSEAKQFIDRELKPDS